MKIDLKNYKMNLRFFTEDEMSFLAKTKGEIHTQNFSRIFFALCRQKAIIAWGENEPYSCLVLVLHHMTGIGLKRRNN